MSSPPHPSAPTAGRSSASAAARWLFVAALALFLALALAGVFGLMFDVNVVSPAPAAETRTADQVVWEFDPPQGGGPLAVSLDARVEPGIQWGRDGEVQLLVGGEPVAGSSFHTWVTP